MSLELRGQAQATQRHLPSGPGATTRNVHHPRATMLLASQRQEPRV